MDIEWKISLEDVTRVQALVLQQANNAFVRNRTRNNLAEVKRQVRKKRFWFSMVRMTLTSVQRSGPNSPVGRFNRTRPFPLSYEAACGATHVETFIAGVLQDTGGIRFYNNIANQLATNFDILENGEWSHAIRQCNRLIRPVPGAVEKEVANYIGEKFAGFGPKQSRNFLQFLGLTRYEIPIDSRVTEWLNEFGFPIRLSPTALADRNYYEFVSQGFSALCERSDVYPCILDAAIFSMRDGDAWTDANVY